MTISDEIRRLAKQGHSKSEIAKLMNIRYQHVQKVLVDSGLHLPKSRGTVPVKKDSKTELQESLLLSSGFSMIGHWRCLEDELVLPQGIPNHQGVYAFTVDGTAKYVGVAKMGLKERIYFYAKPGPTQKTSQRLNKLMRELLLQGKQINLLTARPDDFEWNGLPVHGPAGLEFGLINKFDLPWNMQGSK